MNLIQQTATLPTQSADDDVSLVERLSSDGASAYQQYLQMFVGAKGIAAFLKYELLTVLLGGWPGAAGYFLRAKLYPSLFHKVGRGTLFGSRLVLRCPSRISLGSHVNVDDQVVLDAKGDGSSIETGDRILIGRNSILSCTNAAIRIGDYLSMGPGCVLASKSLIQIGSYVQIGAGTQLMAGSHSHDDPDTPILLQPRVSEGITIEDNVWLGSASLILDGVTIGHDSIVGAGSMVNKNIPPHSMVLGNPARIIQKRK